MTVSLVLTVILGIYPKFIFVVSAIDAPGNTLISRGSNFSSIRFHPQIPAPLGAGQGGGTNHG
jgi:hypothetical protein